MTIISWIRPAAVFLCRVKLDPDPFLIFGDQCPYPRKNQTDPQPPLCAECQIIMYKSLALLARKGSFLKTFPLSRKSSVQARNKYCLICTITHSFSQITRMFAALVSLLARAASRSVALLHNYIHMTSFNSMKFV